LITLSSPNIVFRDNSNTLAAHNVRLYLGDPSTTRSCW